MRSNKQIRIVEVKFQLLRKIKEYTTRNHKINANEPQNNTLKCLSYNNGKFTLKNINYKRLKYETNTLVKSM